MCETMQGLSKVDHLMEDIAMGLVSEYVLDHLDCQDKNDGIDPFTLFIVWKAKVLQNWKFLISTTLLDGMYYELTYNGSKKEWYLDAYKKFDNKCIPEGDVF